MMHFEKYPVGILETIHAFAAGAMNWATASGLSVDDVRQEIAVAVLAGKDPLVEVPRVLGLRKLGKVWRPVDAVCMAGEFDLERHDAGSDGVDGDDVEAVRGDADGIDDIMARAKIGRRAAKIRVKKQWDELQTQGDLFAGVVV